LLLSDPFHILEMVQLCSQANPSCILCSVTSCNTYLSYPFVASENFKLNKIN
jgi:hypothetical protein